MHRSLLLLSYLRLRAQARKAGRTVMTPRGFLMTLVAVAFFSLMLLPYLMTRHLPQAVPREQMPMATWFMHPAALLAFWLFSLAGSHFKSPIAFSMPEVEFLFPGPFSRHQLLIYKLAVSTLGTLGFAILMPLILPMVWGPAALAGIWLALTFMQWSSILLTLAAGWLGASYRWILAAAIAALAAVAVITAWQAGLFDNQLEILDRLRNLEASPAARAVLAPFALFSNVMRAETAAELARWAVPALAVNLFVAVGILALDATFLEASLAASQRRFQAIERLKRSGGLPTLAGRDKPRLGLPMFPRLGGVGTIAWRQSLEMLRTSARLLLALPAVVVPFAAIVATSSKRAGSPVEITIIALTLVAGFMITTMMQLGLRTDLDHIDVIKSLPLSSRRIVWGSLGASILYVTGIQAVAVLAMVAALGQWSVAALLAVALALPINLLTVAADSALVLLFPSIRRFTPGDILVGVRMVMVNFAKFVLAVAAAGLAGLAYAAFRLASAELHLVGLAAAWAVLLCEGVATVWLTAVLFERYDPSAHAVDSD